MATHHKGTAAQARALNAYIPLLRVADSVAAEAARRVEALGLTLTQFGVLEALLHMGPLSQAELCRKLLRSGGNTTLVVKNLAAQGLIKRGRKMRMRAGKQVQDRRAIIVELTPGGRRKIRRIFPEHVDWVVLRMSCLGVEEQERLRELCRKLGRATSEEKEAKDRRAT
jgi:MarR family 2-MHQ and catechol resistance regulon transcriptional repressor